MKEFFWQSFSNKTESAEEVEYWFIHETSQIDYYCNIDTLFVSKKKKQDYILYYVRSR